MQHDVAAAERHSLPDVATMAFSASDLGRSGIGFPSVSEQEGSDEGSFRFAAGAAVEAAALKPRHRVRMRRPPSAAPQQLTALTPAAAKMAVHSITAASSTAMRGIAASMHDAAAPSVVTRGPASCTQQWDFARQSHQDPQSVSFVATHALSTPAAPQQPEGVAPSVRKTPAQRTERQPQRRSRGWWPPWDADGRAAGRHGGARATNAAAISSRPGADGPSGIQQQFAPSADRSTVYDSADSLQSMTAQVTCH